MGRVVRDICPTAPGAKDWNPSAFSPRTGLIYIPHLNLCMDWESQEANYIAGTPYVGADVRMYRRARAAIAASSRPGTPSSGAKAWSIKEDLPLWSGALATAGDVVFYGTMDGWFKAVDATRGRSCWQLQDRIGDHRPAGDATAGPTAASMSPCCRASAAGRAPWWSDDLDTRDPTAAKGFAGAVPDLKERTARGARSMSSHCLDRIGARLIGARTALRASTAACEREERDTQTTPESETSVSSVALSPLQPGEASAPPGGAHRSIEQNAFNLSQGKQLYTLVQLQRLPCPWRRRYRAGADGRPVALRQRDREHLRDHRAGPAQRHAVVPQQDTGQQIWQIAAYVRSMSGLTPTLASPSRSDEMQNKPAEQSMPRQQPKDTQP